MADEKVVEVMARAMYQSLINEKRSFSATGLRVSTGSVDLELFSEVALAALEKAGYAVVPVEPTESMLAAAYLAWADVRKKEAEWVEEVRNKYGGLPAYRSRSLDAAYKAMIAALSDPPKE